MKPLMLALTALYAASLVSCQAACPAKVNFDSCITRARQIFESCGLQDFPCRCQRQKELAQCYNLCPNDPGKGSEEGQVTIWCSYEKQSASAAVPSASAGVSSVSGSVVPTGALPSGSVKPSISGSGAASSQTVKSGAERIGVSVGAAGVALFAAGMMGL
ncbi:uncharacterized protein VTP21DRAFT_5031 [Calcarisporiella thermophila]|uniref:uncharacterized protein n=1 Tax=Calcarisporiella thermophila TaxID=911321 RepID=UPI003743731C